MTAEDFHPADAPPPGASSAPWRRSAAAMVLLAATLCALPAAATQLVPQNLSRLIQGADVIVSGHVKSISDGIDARGVPYTEVTISVASSAKRKLARRSDFTFRQFGLLKPRRMADGRTFLGVAPQGFPQWRKDEHVIAFMYKPAAKTGLRTTVGLAQGKFTTAGGRTTNAQLNSSLFSGVQINPSVLTPAEAELMRRPGGPVDAHLLLSLVHRAVAGQWIEKGVMR
jgi:hypothetical protein